MTNNTPDISKMTRLERIAYFSASKETTTMPTAPVRRLPPRPRRHSVRHRSIR